MAAWDFVVVVVVCVCVANPCERVNNNEWQMSLVLVIPVVVVYYTTSSKRHFLSTHPLAHAQTFFRFALFHYKFSFLNYPWYCGTNTLY